MMLVNGNRKIFMPYQGEGTHSQRGGGREAQGRCPPSPPETLSYKIWNIFVHVKSGIVFLTLAGLDNQPSSKIPVFADAKAPQDNIFIKGNTII